MECDGIFDTLKYMTVQHGIYIEKRVVEKMITLRDEWEKLFAKGITFKRRKWKRFILPENG